MTPSPDETVKPQTLYCRFCKEEFITYKAMGSPECPRCGRQTHVKEHRRLARLVALVIALVVIFAAVVVYVLVLR